jgi:peroxiredoxin
MKKFLALLLLPAFSFAQTASKAGDFLISGNIKGLPDSTMVYLSKPGQGADILATDYAKKGKFDLFGKINEGDVYLLSFIGYPANTEIFLTPNKITVTGDVKTINKLAVAGSAAQQDYQLYNSQFDALKQKLAQLVGVINQSPAGLKRDSLIGAFEKTKQKVMDQVDAFIKNKPGSLVTPFIVYVTSPVSNDIDALEARYNALSPEVRNTFYANEIAKALAGSKVGAEGTQAPDFTQNDTANNPVALSSFKGKYVLVDFWASWCGPCRLENPAVVAAYNSFKDKNFTVLGVSLDQNRDKWINAIHADNLAWTHVSDLKYWQNEAAQLYRINSIPANMLIDPTGKIVARNLRGEALREALDKLLK